MRLTVAFVAAVLLFGGSGTEEAEPGLSESISGTWVSQNDLYVTFNDDGTYEVGSEVGAADREFGIWSADGNVLTKGPPTTNAKPPTTASSTSTITTDPTEHSAGPPPPQPSRTTSPQSTPR